MNLVKWMNATAGRATRVLAGIVLIAAGLTVGGVAGVALAVVGLVPLVAGLAGLCLLAPLMHVPPRAH